MALEGEGDQAASEASQSIEEASTRAEAPDEPAVEVPAEDAVCPTCGRPLIGLLNAPNCQRCGSGEDVARVDHLGVMKDLCPRCQSKYRSLGQLRGENEFINTEGADDLWHHVGGGMFENRETGDRQRGHP